MKIFPSILSANFSDLKEELHILQNYGIDTLHFDVMDGHYVHNISFGLPVLESLKENTKFQFDIHLQIEEPLGFIDSFIKKGADIINVHTNALMVMDKILAEIKANHKKLGIVLNPKEDIKLINPFLSKIDNIILMGVEPGFGGQKIVDSVFNKIEIVKELKKKGHYKFSIEIDGGVNPQNIRKIKDMGVDNIVAGSAVFGNRQTNSNMLYLKSLLN